MKIDELKILTPRLELRPHRLEDVAFMVELNSNPEVTRYVPDGAIEEAGALELVMQLRMQFAERKIGRFLVIERATGQRLGWCGLKWIEETKSIDLGYRFLKSAWGQGYATEAAKACLEYGFNTLKHDKVTATITPTNTASLGVAKKLGMKEVGRVIESGMEFLFFEIHSQVPSDP